MTSSVTFLLIHFSLQKKLSFLFFGVFFCLDVDMWIVAESILTFKLLSPSTPRSEICIFYLFLLRDKCGGILMSLAETFESKLLFSTCEWKARVVCFTHLVVTLVFVSVYFKLKDRCIDTRSVDVRMNDDNTCEFFFLSLGCFRLTVFGNIVSPSAAQQWWAVVHVPWRSVTDEDKCTLISQVNGQVKYWQLKSILLCLQRLCSTRYLCVPSVISIVWCEKRQTDLHL